MFFKCVIMACFRVCRIVYVNCIGIRTRIVRAEGERADPLIPIQKCSFHRIQPIIRDPSLGSTQLNMNLANLYTGRLSRLMAVK